MHLAACCRNRDVSMSSRDSVYAATVSMSSETVAPSTCEALEDSDGIVLDQHSVHEPGDKLTGRLGTVKRPRYASTIPAALIVGAQGLDRSAAHPNGQQERDDSDHATNGDGKDGRGVLG